MPTYEYECDKCSHGFERFQSMTEPPVKRCPKCRGKVRRVFGVGAGIIFKGSGFYATDYRSSGYRNAQKKDAEGATETRKAGDSTPAADAKTKTESATSNKK